MNSEKRNQLIFLVLVTGLALVVLYLTLITGLENDLKQARGELEAERARLRKEQTAVEGQAEVEERLKVNLERLAEAEQRMPQGEAYSWFLQRLDSISASCGVERGVVGPPVAVKADDVASPAKEYGILRGSCEVSGTFESLGRFVAAVENELPYAQIEQLSLETSSSRLVMSAGGLLLRFDFSAVAPLASIPR